MEQTSPFLNSRSAIHQKWHMILIPTLKTAESTSCSTEQDGFGLGHSQTSVLLSLLSSLILCNLASRHKYAVTT